jgi:hypothetical protein
MVCEKLVGKVEGGTLPGTLWRCCSKTQLELELTLRLTAVFAYLRASYGRIGGDAYASSREMSWLV